MDMKSRTLGHDFSSRTTEVAEPSVFDLPLVDLCVHYTTKHHGTISNSARTDH